MLGISLGSLMSRQLLQHLSSYPLTIGLLALATFCTTFGSSYYLQRMHGWDRTSAFLAASPGALSQIALLAIEKGADMPAIAVVQTLRVIILSPALVRWSVDAWTTSHDTETRDTGLGIYTLDLPTASLPPGGQVGFTFCWAKDSRWEETNYTVTIEAK